MAHRSAAYPPVAPTLAVPRSVTPTKVKYEPVRVAKSEFYKAAAADHRAARTPRSRTPARGGSWGIPILIPDTTPPKNPQHGQRSRGPSVADGGKPGDDAHRPAAAAPKVSRGAGVAVAAAPTGAEAALLAHLLRPTAATRARARSPQAAGVSRGTSPGGGPSCSVSVQGRSGAPSASHTGGRLQLPGVQDKSDAHETFETEARTIKHALLHGPNTGGVGLRMGGKRWWEIEDRPAEGPDCAGPSLNGIAERVARSGNLVGCGFRMTSARNGVDNRLLPGPLAGHGANAVRPVTAAFRTVHTDPTWVRDVRAVERADRDRALVDDCRRRMLEREVPKWRAEPPAELQAMLVANGLAADAAAAGRLAPLVQRSDAPSMMSNEERRLLSAFSKRLGDMCLDSLAAQADAERSTGGVVTQLRSLGFTAGQVARLLQRMGLAQAPAAAAAEEEPPAAAAAAGDESAHASVEATADDATRAQRVETLQAAGVPEPLLRPLTQAAAPTIQQGEALAEALVAHMEKFDPSAKEAAAWALGDVARHNGDLAQTVTDKGAITSLVLCVQGPQLSLKRAAAAALGDIAKHSPELAQVVVDQGAIAHLAPLLSSDDTELKRHVCHGLAQIAKHTIEMAELVVEGEIFPKVHELSKDADEGVRTNAAACIREVAKHTPELAKCAAPPE